MFAATGLTWREGQELCENLGGHLAEIKSEEQNIFLVSLAMLEENLIHTESWQIGEWSALRNKIFKLFKSILHIPFLLQASVTRDMKEGGFGSTQLRM